MLSGDMAACIARTASKSCARAGLTSTVLPSVSSAYVAAADLLTGPPRLAVQRAPGSSSACNSNHSPTRTLGAPLSLSAVGSGPRAAVRATHQYPSASYFAVRSSASSGKAHQSLPLGSAFRDDGRDWQPEPALGLTGQVGPEPARDDLGQGDHDDLVELVIGEHLLHGLKRAGTPEIALDGNAQRSQVGQHLAEPLPGLGSRLLIGGGRSVICHPPPHAGLEQDATRPGVILRGPRVRDKHEERTRSRVDPLTEFFLQLSAVQSPVRDNKIFAHADYSLPGDAATELRSRIRTGARLRSAGNSGPGPGWRGASRALQSTTNAPAGLTRMGLRSSSASSGTSSATCAIRSSMVTSAWRSTFGEPR